MGYLSDIVRKLEDEQEVIFVGTGMLLVDEQSRILMARRTDNNEWCIPGGSLELDESLEDCVIRETREETNILIDKEDLHLNWAEAIAEPIIKNGRRIHVVSVSYWADRYNDIDLNIDSREFTKYGWFTWEEIELLGEITPYTRVALDVFRRRKTNGQ